MPVLLRQRPIGLQVVLAGLLPAVFGGVCGLLLGINETAYLVLALLAIGGGYFAGMEHHGPAEGAVRGVVGGTLFGSFILLVHEATGEEATAELPHPQILLVAITAAFGTFLGAMGGRRRLLREERGPKEHRPFELSRLQRGEFIGFAASAVLVGSLFLPWFSTSDSNPNSQIESAPGDGRGTFNAFEVFTSLEWLLIAAASAPFILAYIIARGHALAWRPGELTMIVGMVAFSLILLNGIVLGRPENDIGISLDFGYFVALAGAFGIMAAGYIRQAEGERGRRPPGSLS